MTAWWQRQSPGVRATMILVVFVLGLNLLVTGAGQYFGHEPSGPSSSSYSTTRSGTAALARLYRRGDHHVSRLRHSLHDASLDPASTLLILDPDNLFPDDVNAVLAFLDGGGRVVAAGRGVRPLARAALGGELEWHRRGRGHLVVRQGVPESGRAVTVVADGSGAWEGIGSATPFLTARERVIGLVTPIGRGRLVLLADPSILHNDRLARADNAALAVAVAGVGRPVVFDEHAHGYGAGERGVPTRWIRLLVAATLAVLLWMWVESTRLGPAEDQSRPLPPARREYVDALAVSLSRTREPQAALERLQRRARQRVATSLGLSVDASMEEMLGAAARAGVPAEDVRALFTVPRTTDDIIELGRVAARNGGGRM